MAEKKKETNKKKVVKKNKKTKEVCNTFNISDGKEEKTEVSCGTIEEKRASKEQIKQFSKTLAKVLAFLAFLFILFFAIYYISSSNTVTFKGVDYNKLQVGEVLFYHAQIPYIKDLEGTKYNVYLRSNPKDISKKIPFDEKDISWKQIVVTNFSTNDLVCEGYSIIAQANFNQILSSGIGLTLITDPNASCDAENRYMHISIEAGDETKIEKTGEYCYRLEFTNCEILEVTERFLLEAISKYNERVK